MKRILAMLLSVICVLSFTCVSTYADEKSEDEEKAASIAESYPIILFGPDGTIVARDLRGDALKAKVKEMMQ